MNILFRILGIYIAISLVISGCGALPIQTEQKEGAVSQTAVYESILDKPLADDGIADFLAGNDCSSADQFLLCKSAGVALWIDSNQVVETVYLYLNNEDDFAPYKGELPYGLKFYDTMASVEYKLARQGIGNNGLPDKGVTPDHMHYRATYQQAGMTIIYNYPAPDEGATINAIVVTNEKDPR